MTKKRLISIVVPVYNESGHLERLYRELRAVFEGLPYEAEFVFVDDGSSDGSAQYIESLVQSDTRVRLLQFSRNFGKEAATSAGLVHAMGDAVAMIDADLQHPPAVIRELIRKWEEGYEVVVGVRNPRASEGFLRSLGSRLFAFAMNTIGDAGAPQGATDFRLVDRAVVEAFKTLEERTRMTRALIDWLGFRRAYVRFDAAERADGNARYNYRALTALALDTIVSHSTLPLRLAGYLGTLITFFAGCLGLFVIIEQFMLRDPLHAEVSGTAMLAIMILFLNGIVLICLGLMSLYIGTIQEEAVRRPLFVLRKSIGTKKDA